MTVAEAEKHTAQSGASILILDDDPIILDSLKEFLTLEGYKVGTAGTFDRAREQLSQGGVQILLTDLSMPDRDGLEVLRYVREHHAEVVTILITAYGSISSAVEAIKLGAYDYLTKPIVDDELQLSLGRALKQQSLQAENIALKEKLRRHEQFGDLIGADRQMQKVFELVETVAATSTTVVLTGESGTGKSMVARAIHQQSDRSDGPFVEVSCGALPESLLESELFGHVRGAFTGAVSDKAGRFLTADSGTIFLDEVNSATPAMQVKLLRVLQERCFEPVGSTKTVSVDVRVIVASNSDLKKQVEAGAFREDLYYRLNVVNIHLPPLRDRLGDIRLLAGHFLDKFCRLHDKSLDEITAETLSALQRYRWPGNVRELENMIERAVVLASGDAITVDDLPNELLVGGTSVDSNDQVSDGADLAAQLLQAERAIVRRCLDRHGWSRKATAKALGISRTSLFRKMRQLDLQDGQ